MGATVIGFEELDRAFNEFTQLFGVKAILADEFQAFVHSGEVGYSVFFSTIGEEFFLANAEARYPDIQADIGLWALMHEIGHIKTWGLWTEEEQDYFEHYTEEEIPEIEDDETRYIAYFNTPIEFMATRWAGETMRREPAMIGAAWAKLQNAMMEFYRINGLI